MLCCAVLCWTSTHHLQNNQTTRPPTTHSHPPPKQTQVVHVAVEMAPIAKVGGMGDVVTALARAVQEEGNEVEVVIPKYDCIQYNQVKRCLGF